jgi:hypothetical protein
MVTATRLVRNWREPVTCASSFYGQQKNRSRAQCRVCVCVCVCVRIQSVGWVQSQGFKEVPIALSISGKVSTPLLTPPQQSPPCTYIFVFPLTTSHPASSCSSPRRERDTELHKNAVKLYRKKNKIKTVHWKRAWIEKIRKRDFYVCCCSFLRGNGS